MSRETDLADAIWTGRYRTLVYGTALAPSTVAEQFAASIWGAVERTLSPTPPALTMKLGWNIDSFNYYASQIPSLNVMKWANGLGLSGPGQTRSLPLDSSGVPTAAITTIATTWNIVNAEPGTDYGLAATLTVVTVDADHDFAYGMFAASVRIAGNTGGIPDGTYTVQNAPSVVSFRRFTITATIAAATGAVGTVSNGVVDNAAMVSSLACRSIDGHYPGGTYDFYNGADVAFTFGNDANKTVNATSWNTGTVTPSTNGIQLKTGNNWSSGGVFKAILPGHKTAYEAGSFWYQKWLSLIASNRASCIRHMSTQRTNNSNVRTWSQRTPQTAGNSLNGRTITRPIKITGSVYGNASTYFGSSSTLTLTCPTHGLTTGDIIYVRCSNGTPTRYNYRYQVEVVDGDTIRVVVLDAQTVEMTWGWADANVYCGACYEDLIDLHNNLRLDMWICIPHLADDDFVTQLGTLLATTLHSSIKVYVEYSNETWQVGSGSFIQGHYCGCQSGLDATYNTQNRWAGKRARECFDLFDAAWIAAGVTNPRTRVYRVASTQHANTDATTKYLFGLTDPITGKVKADVLAVAPYYERSSAPSSLADLKAQCLSYINTYLIPWTTSQKALADAAVNDEDLPLRLVAYEGGESLTGSDSVTESFSTSTERYDCDTALLTAMQSGGITLWCHLSFITPDTLYSGRYYQWGALQWMDDVDDNVYRPTWAAVRDFWQVPLTPKGFRSPFPFVLGLMGGTTYAPGGLTITSVHDYIQSLHGRIDVLGMNVSGAAAGTRTVVREHTTPNGTDTIELEVVEA